MADIRDFDDAIHSHRLTKALRYLFLVAHRGSLQVDTAWYFEKIGKEGQEARASRNLLEKIYFVQKMFDLQPAGIYQMMIGDNLYKQAYLSSAEVIKYIIKHCHSQMSDDFLGFWTNKEMNSQVRIRFVAYDIDEEE